MPKGKRGHEEVETYESDGGFVSNDDGNAPKSKKSKKVASKATGKDESKFWEISSGRTPRRVEVSKFNKATLVNIREFYEKNDEYLPGKKGISLTVDQYKAFLKAIPEINASLRSQGIQVEGSGDVDEDDESEEEVKPKKKVKAKKEEKSNIEATSDEDE